MDFWTVTLLCDTLEIKPDRWNVFSSRKRRAFNSCVKTGFPCTAPLKQPSLIKWTLVSASRCKVVSGHWRVENKNLHHPVYVLTSEMRKGTQVLLVSCSVSCKSLHLGVSSLKSFNWCLGVFMAAEGAGAQQGIQSEEAWVQREANWAGRSLSAKPWMGMTGRSLSTESLGECGCVNGTQTDSCSAQYLHWAQGNGWSFRKQCFVPSWQLLFSGVQALRSPNVTQAVPWTGLLSCFLCRSVV